MNEPIDLQIFIGASDASNLDRWVANQTLLVDADEQVCEQLREFFCNDDRVNIVQYVVADKSGEVEWISLNIPEYNSISQPTGLFDSFPGLKVSSKKPVQSVGVLDLLERVITEDHQRVGLVLNLPDISYNLLTKVLSSELKHRLVNICVATQSSAMYGNEASYQWVYKELQQQRYLLHSENIEDPDFPILEFFKNPLAEKIDIAEKESKKEQNVLREALSKSENLAASRLAELAQAKEKSVELEAKIVALTLELDFAKQQSDSARHELDKALSEKDKMYTEAKQAGSSIENLQSQIKDKELEKEALTKVNEGLELKLGIEQDAATKARKEVSTLVERARKTDIEIEKLSAQLSLLQELMLRDS